MTTAASGLHPKPLLALKNGLPSGTVLLDANSRLLDSTSRKKTYHWQFTTDLGKSFSPMPSTPVARTSIANLTPLTTVGFQVSVSVNQQPQGPWSQTVSILVRQYPVVGPALEMDLSRTTIPPTRRPRSSRRRRPPRTSDLRRPRPPLPSLNSTPRSSRCESCC